jgi:diguanylate cyclase (GGDEF)-like protein
MTPTSPHRPAVHPHRAGAVAGARRFRWEARLRRWARRGALTGLAGAVCVLLWSGAFHDFRRLGWGQIAACGALAGGLAFALVRRLRRSARKERVLPREDLELGLLLLCAAYVPVALTGAVTSPLYPIVYLLSAFFVAFLPAGIAVALALLSVGIDAGVFAFGGHLPSRWPLLVAHSAFTSLFLGLYHAVLAARLHASRRAEREAVSRRVKEAEERAREYRLIATSGSGEGAREKWLLAAVSEVETAVKSALEVAEVALKPHTVAVLLLSPDGESLRLRECLSRDDRVARGRVSAAEGVLGAVLKRRAPLRLCGEVHGVSWYEEGAPAIHAVVAVPLVERRGGKTGGGETGDTDSPAISARRSPFAERSVSPVSPPPVFPAGLVRGVLLADRTEARAFSEEDEKLLETLGRELLRAVESERVLGAIRREKDEKEHFFRAIEELNRASRPDDVAQAAARLARELAPALDFAVVTRVVEAGGRRRHRIVAADGEGAREYAGKEWGDNQGLVANVVRLAAPLPGRDVQEMEKPLVFCRDVPAAHLGSLKILPLGGRAQDRPLGTLVASARKPGQLNEEAVRLLQVLALQAAGSLERAELYDRAEKLAITDGLTGLYNHRHFQGLLERELAEALRYKKRLSLLLGDIDHFKAVNDTYGHPAGDVVLKGVAEIIAREARGTDACSRYGGEEFAVLMPETDARGAQAIAERIRRAVAACEFQTDLGPLRVTLSLGLATAPDDAADRHLVEHADQALYHAKRTGRDRVVAFSDLSAPRRAQA